MRLWNGRCGQAGGWWRIACALQGFAALVGAGSAAATVADDLCPPADDPCTITGSHDVEDLSVLDFGTRAVVLEGTLDVASGEMSISAGSFTIAAAGQIRGDGGSDPGGTVRITTAGNITIDSTVLQGGILLTGLDGGILELSAAGAIMGSGVINLDAGGLYGLGGEATLMGFLGIDLTGDMKMRGGSSGSGGIVTMDTLGALDVADIDVSGGQGGELDLAAVGELTVGDVDGTGRGFFGPGGIVNLRSASKTVVAGTIDLTGDALDGPGGELSLGGAAGALPDIETTGSVMANGRGLGVGGLVTLEGDEVAIPGMVETRALGSSAGGDLDVSARSFTLTGVLDATGDETGGDVEVVADEALALQGSILAEGDELSGGTLLASTGGPLTLAATVSVASQNAAGGSTRFAGCALTAEPDAQVDVAGVDCTDACSIRFEASGPTDLAGDYQTTAAGLVDITRRDAVLPVDVSAATFDLAPTIGVDPALPACPGDADGDGTADEGDNCPMTFNQDQEDAELDGTGDVCDNCTLVANGSLVPDAGGNVQLDQDADGFGNVCDCDFDGDGVCSIADFNVFLPDFVGGMAATPGTDMNGDGFINITDFNLFLAAFTSGTPGPSAFVP